MKIAFFDTKNYDKPSFDRFGAENGVEFKYFETKLNEDTVELANGYDGVCVFVNDTVRYVELDELFEKSDIISLHCPLTEDTYHLINSDTLAICKRGVVLINTSRGALVDAEALLAEIKSRKVGAACLDVYEEESDFFFEDFSDHILEDDILARLISMPNVIVTSHQAFLTEEALSNIAETTVDNIVGFFKNGQCLNELCYRCGSAEDCRVGKCF